MSQIVDLAILVRRGQLKLASVPEKDRATVNAVAQSLTDAQLGVIIHARDHKTKQLGRTPIRSRDAVS